MSNEKEVRVPGLTAKSLTIGLLIVIVMSALYGSSCFETWPPLGLQSVWGFIFILMLFFALINYARPGTFSIQELAVINIMVMMGMAWWLIYMGDQLLWIALFATPSTVLLEHPTLENFPEWIWGPKDSEIVNSIFPASTLNINFGAFAQSLGWFYLLMISMFLCYLFLLLLLRPAYMIREALPYPLTMFQEYPLVMAQKGEKSRIKLLEMKFFLIGFLIGFLWLLPWPIYDPTNMLPAAQLPSEWAWLKRGEDLTKLGLLPWVALGIRAPCELLPNIFFALLWPLEALFGWVFGWVVLSVIFPVTLYSMGWLPTWTAGTGYWTVKFGWEMGRRCPYFQNFNDGVSLGLILVFTFYPLWRNRDLFKRIFSGFYRRIPEDAESPIPYQYVWWGLIIFAILQVVGWSWLGLPWYWAIYLVAIILIYLPGCIWALGTTLGTSPFYVNRGGWVDIWQNWPPQTVSVSLLYFRGGLGVYDSPVANATTYLFLSYDEGYYALFGGLVTPAITAFKLADNTNTRIKDVFKAIVVAGLLSIIIVPIARLIWVHWYPIKPGTKPYTMDSWAWFSNILRSGMQPNPWPGFLAFPRNINDVMATISSIIVGVVYGVLVFLARARFPWFRVDPAGTLLMINFEWCMNWLPFILATIIKYAVIKVAGVEKFNKYLLPLSAGVVIGTFVINGIVMLVMPFTTGAFTLPE